MMEKRSITAEDYLKSIEEFTSYQGYASLSDLAHHLCSKRQSSYDEMKILVQQGFVERTAKGQYVLTEAGTREANIFLRKHRIAEILLWKSLSIPWEAVDDEAMGIEHGITDEIAKAVCEKFGCEKCPHGNPVPAPDGSVVEPKDVFFSQLEPDRDQDVYISRVIFENPEILTFLGQNDLLPGSKLHYKADGQLFFDSAAGFAKIESHIARAIKYLPG